MLSVRHDKTARLPDAKGISPLYNGNCKGNVVFCDGHTSIFKVGMNINVLSQLVTRRGGETITDYND